jgi:hypothetical protein
MFNLSKPLSLFLIILAIILFLYFLSLANLFFLKNHLQSNPISLPEYFTNSSTNLPDPTIDSQLSTQINKVDERIEEQNYDEYLLTPHLYQMKNGKKKIVQPNEISNQDCPNKNSYGVCTTLKPQLNPYETQPLEQALQNSFMFPDDEGEKHPDERRNEIAHTLMRPMHFTSTNNGSNNKTEIEGYSEVVHDDHGQSTKAPTSCQIKHKHKNCMYGPSNYPEPCDMTPVDREIFKASYPTNMTLQDYVNWLWLYYDTPEDLSYDHLRNLRKLIVGDCLVYQAGILPPPAKKYAPANSQDYFQKLYNINNLRTLRTILRDDTDGLIESNSNQYASLYQNFDKYGKSSTTQPGTVNPNIIRQHNAELIDQLLRPLMTPKPPKLQYYSTQEAKPYQPRIPDLSINIT